jgi:site-specific DNA-methyltransferase (adenine-specific)
MDGKNSILFSKNSDEWETSKKLFEKLDREFGFEIDAASTPQNKLCRFSFTKFETNALERDWTEAGDIFYLNPPYSKIAAFMQKACEESVKGAIIVCLIPSRTDTAYWHDYVMQAAEIRFIRGRLKFSGNENSAPFPSCIVVFDVKLRNLIGLRVSSMERE